MIINENSKVIPFQANRPTNEEIRLLHIPEEFYHTTSNLIKIGDTFYYYKGLQTLSLINELIGSYLAKKIGLHSVNYEIGKKDNDGALFALSKVFYEEGYQYQSISKFLEENHCKDCFDKLKNPFFQSLPVYYSMRTLKLYRGTPFYDNNLKLIAVDLKMAQHDRHKSNMQIQIGSKGVIDLAPIYDYGRAYAAHFDLAYANPFVYMRYTKQTFRILFIRYPELRDYVEYLRSISIEEILDGIASIHGVQFTEEEYREYHLSQKQNDALFEKLKIKRFF